MLIAVKYIHLLAIITWIGSVIFFSFVATPSIFKTFDRKVAGDIVGAIFPKYFMLTEAAIFVALATLVFVGLKTGMTGAIKVGLVLLASALIVASFSGFYIGPKAREVKTEYRAETDETKVAELKKSFGKLHGISMALNIFNLLIGLVLVYFALTYLRI